MLMVGLLVGVIVVCGMDVLIYVIECYIFMKVNFYVDGLVL